MAKFDIVAVTKTIVRSVAVTFPPMTAYVNAWNEHEAEETKRRLDLFRSAFVFEAQRNTGKFEAVQQDVETMGQRMQVFERAVEAARREPSNTKLTAIARFTANAMIAESAVTQDDKLTLIETLDTLTDTDLTTLGRFSAGRTLRVEKMAGNGASEEALGRLVASLRKLDARGLVSETNHKGSLSVTGSVGDPDHWTNVWKNKDIEILPLGKTLVELLKEGGGTAVTPPAGRRPPASR